MTITPGEAKARIHSQDEVALLDIREHGQYGEGHPFLSVHCPFSSLETEIIRLVPHVHTEIILMDDGDGVAERALQILRHMGYTRASAMQGGAPGWSAAGFTLFKGVNLPSKTLGELVEHRDHPNMMTPTQLHDWMQTGKSFALFDCRPPSEYAKMTLPTAHCVPNGELAHRIGGLVQDPDQPIVITCAGRTRGLIGWSGLAALKLPNPIYAIENGTQGWALAGHALQRDNPKPAMPALTPEAKAISQARAEKLMAEHHLKEIAPETLLEFAKDPARCVFLVDVRSEEEFAREHLPQAQHAWSGQIVQATDLTAGVRRARIVLSDDTGMRAALAALWLKTLGYEAFILRKTRASDLPTNWRSFTPSLPVATPVPHLSPTEAYGLMQTADIRLVDFRGSQAFRNRHATGSVWASRPRLASHPLLHKGQAILLMHEDPVQAAFIAEECTQLGLVVKGLVKGGLKAWQLAGLETSSSPDVPADADCIDFLFFVHDRHDGNLESARRYLEWETGLIAQLDAQEQASFSL
jgi:rhodanese-related sulfurtransferase